MSIRFKSDSHEYFNEQDDKYLSVSGVEKLLEPKKDWKVIATKKAKKLTKEGTSTTAQDLLDLWERQKIKGSGAGTIYHSIEEGKLIKSGGIQVKSCQIFEGLKYSLKETKLENNTIYPELIVYSHEYKVAGQVDEVKVKNGVIHVGDHKTDKEIKRKAFSSEWIPAEKLLPPVAHLDNCNFNTYSIKMSMYMFLLWKQNMNLKIGDLILHWVQFERDEQGIPILIDGIPVVLKKEDIKVPYLRKEVKDILEWYKAGKLK